MRQVDMLCADARSKKETRPKPGFPIWERCAQLGETPLVPAYQYALLVVALSIPPWSAVTAAEANGVASASAAAMMKPVSFFI
jgi:hypothetical protein